VLAANMSTCFQFHGQHRALFTRNLYKEYFNPAADDKMMLRMGSGFPAGIDRFWASGFALGVKQVLDAFLFHPRRLAAFMGI